MLEGQAQIFALNAGAVRWVGIKILAPFCTHAITSTSLHSCDSGLCGRIAARKKSAAERRHPDSGLAA